MRRRVRALTQGHCLIQDPDLAAALAEGFALLGEGAADPASIWHSPTLATTGSAGAASLRTVVLRGFAADTRLVDIHTDIRSAKFGHLRANNVAGLHGWDARRKIQLRVTGSVSLHTSDAVADLSWARLRPTSRQTYRVAAAPGSVVADSAETLTEVEARLVFCVIRLRFDVLEWLHLAQGSHRRARFTWAAGGVTAIWLVP